MRWTKDKPTEQGWYWLKENSYLKPRIVRLTRHDGSLFVNVWDPVGEKDGYWYGPIEEPEGPED
jgi:hypothetical protein